jgi:hypothetical protein
MPWFWNPTPTRAELFSEVLDLQARVKQLENLVAILRDGDSFIVKRPSGQGAGLASSPRVSIGVVLQKLLDHLGIEAISVPQSAPSVVLRKAPVREDFTGQKPYMRAKDGSSEDWGVL